MKHAVQQPQVSEPSPRISEEKKSAPEPPKPHKPQKPRNRSGSSLSAASQHAQAEVAADLALSDVMLSALIPETIAPPVPPVVKIESSASSSDSDEPQVRGPMAMRIPRAAPPPPKPAAVAAPGRRAPPPPSARAPPPPVLQSVSNDKIEPFSAQKQEFTTQNPASVEKPA